VWKAAGGRVGRERNRTHLVGGQLVPFGEVTQDLVHLEPVDVYLRLRDGGLQLGARDVRGPGGFPRDGRPHAAQRQNAVPLEQPFPEGFQRPGCPGQ